MKARLDENNNVVVANELPNKFRNTVGGYARLASDRHYADGWRDVVIPEYDKILQRLGDVYFDHEKDIFTYRVIDIEFDFDGEKIKKIKAAKQQSNALLNPTDWHVIRQIERGEAIPEEVASMRQAIVTRCNEIETEITGLGYIRDVLTYQIVF